MKAFIIVFFSFLAGELYAGWIYPLVRKPAPEPTVTVAPCENACVEPGAACKDPFRAFRK